jgi:hypothetical protein
VCTPIHGQEDFLATRGLNGPRRLQYFEARYRRPGHHFSGLVGRTAFLLPYGPHTGTNKEPAATGSKSPVHVQEELPVVDHTTSGGRCHDTCSGLEKQWW